MDIDPALEENLETLQATILDKKLSAPQVVQLCNEAGYLVLGLGGRRFAIPFEGMVAKLAFKPQGLADNHLEWLFYKAASPEVSRLLAPTYRHSPQGINWQGRCRPILVEDLDNAHILTRQLVQAGIGDVVINLGLYEDKVVCYDYALLRAETANKLLHPF